MDEIKIQVIFLLLVVILILVIYSLYVNAGYIDYGMTTEAIYPYVAK